MVGQGGPGWARLAAHPAVADWAAVACPVAERVVAQSPEPWRCGGTWFVGVDALPNGPDGRIGDVPFPWDALPVPPQALHPAQLSVIRPGYPQPSATESPAAFRFRRDRDAAHLDGLLAVGADKQRMIREPHGWILGLPLNACSEGASPLVVWEGSHLIVQAAIRAALVGHHPADWGDVDLSAAYRSIRAEVFIRCPRIVVPALPGEATLLHRLTLHGVAPWREGATAPAVGRMIAYLRPQMASVAEWLAGV